jgi:PTH2 family peptidyl-tRNA hydrolase
MSYKQVFIINQSLDMGKGKIAVQTAHGEIYYMQYLNQPHSSGHTEFAQWMKDGVMKKIVLKASESEFPLIIKKLNVERIWFYVVKDIGLTQIEAGSITCIVVEPLLEAKTHILFGYLKLL